MPKVNVDLSNVEKREALPSGKYECIISSVKYTISRDSGEPNIKWEFTVAEGEHESRKLFMNTSLQPKALWKLQQVFEGLGLPSNTASELDFDDETNELMEPNLLAKAVLVTATADRVYQGRKQNDVQSIVGSDQLIGSKTSGKSGKRNYA